MFEQLCLNHYVEISGRMLYGWVYITPDIGSEIDGGKWRQMVANDHSRNDHFNLMVSNYHLQVEHVKSDGIQFPNDHFGNDHVSVKLSFRN